MIRAALKTFVIHAPSMKGPWSEPTSHMVVVARSRSINGPWENCPHNPIVRTVSRDEPWWSRGHATAVEGPGGQWWLIYHGYENGLRTLGRQMLLDPIEWTTDGWPRATGGDLSRPMRKPGGAGGAHGQPLSGFGPDAIGNKLTFWAPRSGYLDRAEIAGGALTLMGQGPARILVREILPNILSPLMVQVSVGVAFGIVIEAGLSFLGLGVQPPTPSLGVILADGREYFQSAPWVLTLTGLVVSVALLGLNLLGDGLRDLADPRLRRAAGP